jgi:hypothetical protein
MPTYVAVGRDTFGTQRKERISAESPNDARNLLKEQGLYVLDLKEERGFSLEYEKYSDGHDQGHGQRQGDFLPTVRRPGQCWCRPGHGDWGYWRKNALTLSSKKRLLAISADVQQGTSLSDCHAQAPGLFRRPLCRAGSGRGSRWCTRRSVEPSGKTAGRPEPLAEPDQVGAGLSGDRRFYGGRHLSSL